MGRLKPEFIERVEDLVHRIIDVAEVLEKEGRSRRLVDQLIGSGSSVGANICEADEALSPGSRGSRTSTYHGINAA